MGEDQGMGQRRRDKKQRKLTQVNTAAIYATAGMNQAGQTQQMAMQQEQLRIAQMQAAEAQAAAAVAQAGAAQKAGQLAATAMDAPQWHLIPLAGMRCGTGMGPSGRTTCPTPG